MSTIRDGDRDELEALRAETQRLREQLVAATAAPAEAADPSAREPLLSDFERVAGGFAHDFNNLLLVMMGSAEVALELLPEDSPVREHLLGVQATAEQSGRLCQQLLTLARRTTVEQHVIDLREAILGELELLRHTAGAGIEVVAHLDDGPGFSNIALGELEQVLFNLVLNARDAFEGEGRIDVELRNLATGAPMSLEGTHSILPPGSWLSLTVRDAGIGMSPETMEQIFSPFFTTKAPGRGTGLGLTLCREIVARSGGFMDVDSALGEGTRVIAYFPRIDEPPAPLPTIEGEGTSLPADTTVLLVEDEPLVREVLKDGLERLGIRVVEAGSRGEALSLVERYRSQVDLIVSDLDLPDGDGRELVELARRRVPGLRWLFITGLELTAEEARAALGSSGGLLRKPFTPEALRSEVQQLMGRGVAKHLRTREAGN